MSNVQDQELWNQLVRCKDGEFEERCLAFLGNAKSRVGLVRGGLQGNVMEKLTAIAVFGKLSELEQIELFPDVLRLCTILKFRGAAERRVLEMPREWVVGHIRDEIDKLLDNADNLDYLMLLALLEKLDLGLAVELARRASMDSDYDIREVGTDFLKDHGP